MPNLINFDNIAPYYESLCQFVFGQRIRNVQIESLKYIPVNSSVLIVGGGTGWILEEIAKIHPYGLKITYIDISSKMIQLSKKRFLAFNEVEFINESIEHTSLQPQSYDVILTPFLFDNFSQITIEPIFNKINFSLKSRGLWIYIDFYLSEKSKNWQKLMIRMMYVFFRLTCKIEANKLPDMSKCFSNFESVSKKKHYNDFIISEVLKKE